MLYLVAALCVLNLIFTTLIGMNTIQLREIIQGWMEGPPNEFPMRDPQGEGLEDVETSQAPYSVEPLLEE